MNSRVTLEEIWRLILLQAHYSVNPYIENLVTQHVRSQLVSPADAHICRVAYNADTPQPNYAGAMVRGYTARSYLDHTLLVQSALRAMRVPGSALLGLRTVLLGGGAAPEALGWWNAVATSMSTQETATVFNVDRFTQGWRPLSDLTCKAMKHLSDNRVELHFENVDMGHCSVKQVCDRVQPDVLIQQYMANELRRTTRIHHYYSMAEALLKGSLSTALLVEPARYNHADDMFLLTNIPGVRVLGELRRVWLPLRYGAHPLPGLRHCLSPNYSFFRRGYSVNALLLSVTKEMH